MDAINLSKLLLSFDSYSHKKIQKLLYYVYSWYYTISGEVPARINFEAWVHGPVCPDVYQEYKKYGWKEIPSISIDISDSSLIYKVTEKVVDIYGGLSADDLEKMTHKEEPWKKARKDLGTYESSNKNIDLKDIRDYYSEQDYYKIFKELSEN